MSERRPITIYHVHFKDSDIKPMDYYFGSISAIFERFSDTQIGIKASSLYNLNLNEEVNPVYENKKCFIRKSTLITKSKSK